MRESGSGPQTASLGHSAASPGRRMPSLRCAARADRGRPRQVAALRDRAHDRAARAGRGLLSAPRARLRGAAGSSRSRSSCRPRTSSPSTRTSRRIPTPGSSTRGVRRGDHRAPRSRSRTVSSSSSRRTTATCCSTSSPSGCRCSVSSPRGTWRRPPSFDASSTTRLWFRARGAPSSPRRTDARARPTSPSTQTQAYSAKMSSGGTNSGICTSQQRSQARTWSG